MANTSRVNGFRPTKYLNGAEWNGQANLYFIPNSNAVATFIGDVMKQETTGDTAAVGGSALGIPTAVQSAAGNAIVGVLVGMIPGGGLTANQQYVNLNSPQYRAASVGVYCWLVDDPMVLFEVQSNGTNAPGDIAQNVDIVVGAGSVVTGQSGMQMNTTVAATATFPFKLVMASQRQDNDITSANAKWLVKPNNHVYAGGTGTVGI